MVVVVDATAAMAVVVLARRAAVRGLALDVVHDRAPGRDRAVLLAVVPSRAAAPSPRMDPNRRRLSPALVLCKYCCYSNITGIASTDSKDCYVLLFTGSATPSRSPVPVHRSVPSPARARVPSLSVARAAGPSPRITNPALVHHGIRTHARALGHEIVLTRKTSATNLAPLRPKTMTIRPIGTTKVTKIRFSVVLLIGKVQYFYINTHTYIFATLTS